MLTPNLPEFFAGCDSDTIQNAIEAAVQSGSRQLTIPRYNARTDCMQWRISKAIRLPDDFTLILDNCYMVQETGVYDNMFTNSRAFTDFTLDAEQKNITILGKGNVCLDGGEHNHLLEKTSGRYGFPRVWKNAMFLWHNVNGLHIEGLHIENQRWWAITHVCCRNVAIKNINFDAIPHVPNMDGIDLRIGCNHFDIQNITGRTGDDVIAMSAISGTEYGWKVEGKDTDIHDVKIRNVLGDPFIHLVVRFLNHDGNQIYNIDVDTVMDVSDYTTKKRPHATIDMGCALYSKIRPSALGETRAIRVRNVTSRGMTAVRLNHKLTDAVFTNIKTYGDNIDCIGTQGKGGHMENVCFEDVYYGSTQQEIFVSTPLPPEKYHGAAVNLSDVTGNISIRNLTVDKVRHLVQANQALSVSVENQSCTQCLIPFRLSGGAQVRVDGEVME